MRRLREVDVLNRADARFLDLDFVATTFDVRGDAVLLGFDLERGRRRAVAQQFGENTTFHGRRGLEAVKLAERGRDVGLAARHGAAESMFEIRTGGDESDMNIE